MTRSVAKGVVTSVVLAVMFAAGVAGCSSADNGDSGAPKGAKTPVITGSSDPAAKLVESKCTMCHGIDRVEAASKSGDEWASTVDRMKSNGMVITDEEYDEIVGFLSGSSQ